MVASVVPLVIRLLAPSSVLCSTGCTPTRHVGKIPKGVQARFGDDEKAARKKDLVEQLEKKIVRLEDELKSALEAENFEECARLRDEIQTLKESTETSAA